jgi:hypothetical protein
VRSNQQHKCSADAARLSTTAGPITDYPSVLHYSHGVANECYAERSGFLLGGIGAGHPFCAVESHGGIVAGLLAWSTDGLPTNGQCYW